MRRRVIAVWRCERSFSFELTNVRYALACRAPMSDMLQLVALHVRYALACRAPMSDMLQLVALRCPICFSLSRSNVRYASACRAPMSDMLQLVALQCPICFSLSCLEKEILSCYGRQVKEALAIVDARTAATTLEPGATATGPSPKLEFTRQSGRSLSLLARH